MRRGLFAAVALVLAVLTPVESSAAAVSDVGFEGASYAPASAPTAEKPQSKLWHHGGRWWGVLFDATSGDYTIHRFNWSSNDWTNTGVIVDNRNASHADALSDGDLLYVATALRPGSSSPDSTVRFLRYSYDATDERYVLDSGFPVVLHEGPLEAIVIDKDTQGAVWATFTAPNPEGGRSVYVTHTTTGDSVWVSPYVLPTAGATTLTSDDISAVVVFRSQIGVMWSNQNEDIVYFATHRDGDPDDVWELSPALQGPRYADDHISLKSLQAGPDGEVVAAVKTELQDADAPLILLLVLHEGSWTRHTFGRVADDHTRPLVVVDEESRQVYVFAASPCCSGGSVYLKQSPLDNISFPTGLGTPFIHSSTNPTINNPTSTKQAVNSTTGLLVLAGDDGTHTYLHNTISLSSSIDTTIDAGPSGVVPKPEASFEFSSSVQGAGFECRLDSAPYAGCTSPTAYSGLSEGPHTFDVRATDAEGNVDPTPAQRTWNVDAEVPQVTSTAPVDGTTGVNSTGAVEATFSEPMDPSSLTTTTFHLTPGGGEPVAATVQYDGTSRTATLRPQSTLMLGTEYRATVVGGASGVRDTAGTALPSDSTWAFTTELTDTSPPDTSIGDSSASGAITTSTASFDFSSSEPGSTFECRLDGAVYRGCTSPHALIDLADGDHTFEVRAIDSASNVDATPASRSFVVDALIFSDGFESGDLSLWSVDTGSDGTASVQSDLVRTGSYAARLRATSNANSYSYAFRALASPRTDLTVSADVYMVDEGGSGNSVPLLTLKDSKGTLVRVERVNGSGSLAVYHARTSFATEGSLPGHTWSRLLLRVVTAGPGASTVEVRLDGTSIYRTTSADLGTAGVSRVQIGSDAKRRRFETVVDDVTVRR